MSAVATAPDIETKRSFNEVWLITIGHALTRLTTQVGVKLIIPAPALCTDNGAMIAWAGLERLRLGLTDGMDFAPRPRWPLDASASPAHNGKA
jgi:N6-L-threonylcarbamoyladenine synthase